MKPITQTRFKLVLLGLALGLVEGVIRICSKEFPVIEVFGFQGAIVGAYLGTKTVSNIKRMKFEGEENGGEEPKP